MPGNGEYSHYELIRLIGQHAELLNTETGKHELWERHGSLHNRTDRNEMLIDGGGYHFLRVVKPNIARG